MVRRFWDGQLALHLVASIQPTLFSFSLQSLGFEAIFEELAFF